MIAGVKASTTLAGFTRPVRQWFRDVFPSPTSAQVAAWQTIGKGDNALIIAPTGSGKTLAAFLHSLDRLCREPNKGKVRVLYISPLKALAVDVERNLRAPLRGIQETAAGLGVPVPEVSVAVRSGDTSSNERRRLLLHPPDILITTPESLFLMLSSQVAGTLDGLETIIVDEVHYVAGTKRGAHLMVSLERLDDLNANGPSQRIGLSATVRPADRVARFLGGSHPVKVIRPPAGKIVQLDVLVGVDDMTQLATPAELGHRNAPPSIWPHIEEQVLDLITTHGSTICFVNSRRIAERMTAHLNELYAERLEASAATTRPLVDVNGHGPPSDNETPDTGFPLIAEAHHGSVSKERRAQVEAALKAGSLRCVVATSSLELGIDMGAVDLVIQIASPPSVASGLQRVGRAGHHVGAVSQGSIFPTSRADLLEAAVVVEGMLAGDIEPVRSLRNPLDVLAQQLVSTCLDHPRTAQSMFEMVRRVDCYRELPRSAFDGVLDMLCGRYPSEDFAELRPKLVWDRGTDLVVARPGSRRLVTTSGGTIPDRGLFGVLLVGDPDAVGTHQAGRRVGELDEEMVHESRIGDVFTLGTSSWRVEQITPNQVLVSPAPGAPGRAPFWKGDSFSRPTELGRAIGAFTREMTTVAPAAARQRGVDAGLDDRATCNLLNYLGDQQQATGQLPSDTTVLLERFRDELGAWRVCIHCSLGSSVLTPWSLAIERHARDRHGVDVRATVTNDGIILRIPDVEGAPPGPELLYLDADSIESIVAEEVLGSALFAARFRECSARALLLPRRDPGKRSPLWQQRLRASQLLTVASNYPDFPITLETMRECLEDVFDLPALHRLLRDIAARRMALVVVETEQPSPFARSLMFGYTGQFIYDQDQPLAERRLAALSLDPQRLTELLGQSASEELLTAAMVREVDTKLQRLEPAGRARSLEQLWDLLRTLGPLTVPECLARSSSPETEQWLATLIKSGRVATCQLNGREMVAISDDLRLVHTALGMPPIAQAPGGPDEALDRLLIRWLLHHAVSSAPEIADRYGVPVERVRRRMAHLVSVGTVLQGSFTTGAAETQYCHHEVLDLLKRRALAHLRSQVESVDQRQFARFLPNWQGLATPGLGVDAVLAAIDQLAGYPIPASMVEAFVLAARVRDYQPGMLDELVHAGEVVWTGHGQLGQHDGWVQLWPRELVLTQPGGAELTPPAEWLAARLAGGGAWRLDDLATDEHPPSALIAAVWELAWSGRVTADSFGPVRELSRHGAVRRTQNVSPRRRMLTRPPRPGVPRWGPVGRWSLVEPTDTGAPALVRAVELELGRYGVLTRGSVLTETLTPNYPDVYRVLSAMEDVGSTRRGFFIAGLGAAQFALPGAVDRLRGTEKCPGLLLASCDPANPFGAALPWPATQGHRPARKAGSLVVLDDGYPVIYLERGAHTLITFAQASPDQLDRALSQLAAAVDTGHLGAVTIRRVNAAPALQELQLGVALERAGFVMVPQGYRRRRTRE